MWTASGVSRLFGLSTGSPSKPCMPVNHTWSRAIDQAKRDASSPNSDAGELPWQASSVPPSSARLRGSGTNQLTTRP
eukprot:6886058-Prymnesium_polylepis.2